MRTALASIYCTHKAWATIGVEVQPCYLSHVAGELIAHPEIYFVAAGQRHSHFYMLHNVDIHDVILKRH